MAKKLLKPFHFFINEIVVDVFVLGNAIRMSYSVILKIIQPAITFSKLTIETLE